MLDDIMPNNKNRYEWLTVLNEILPKYAITENISRLAMYFAQTCHESLNFTVLEENLNYSSAGLLRVFPKYFNEETAKLHAFNPEKIANVVYSNRMGNNEPGDGYKYRGRGIIQLTGKDNYREFAKYINNEEVFKNPDILVTDKTLCVLSSCWFWKSNNLNIISDMNDVKGATKKINGGTHGLDDRATRFGGYGEVIKKYL